ncbi:uncharacterized protein LOC132713041 isoform X3 [Ruditapes philippinarum]|uniref:uncharacterized protein LOC132713041 isoform X3 n=1 Tax=Ruditapes philippinarum TaxID=129788 RepID=UPI00295A8067|nr:uncharacterized protein LOC132713041 isoform X3 [Ruditapes philippinarum]
MSNKTTPRKGMYFTWDMELPKISNNKITLSRNLPKDRALVRQLTTIGPLASETRERQLKLKRQYTSFGEFPRIKQHINTNNVCVFTNRKAERDRKWQLKGWEAETNSEDGLTGWMKRKNILESKKGVSDTRKRSPRLDTDYYIPVKHRCPGIEDLELFRKESLHIVFQPTSVPDKPIAEDSPGIKLRYTNKDVTLAPGGFVDGNTGENDIEKTLNKFRESKATSTDGLHERRSRSVQDLSKNQLERTNTYLKIKRLIKFSTKERPQTKVDDEEDEGYSSKTSSAEVKKEPESDSEENGLDRLERQRMFSSMVDLTELPSHSNEVGGGNYQIRDSRGIEDAKVIGESLTSRVKFSYTHQPTILQLPDPDVKLSPDNLRVEKRIENEDTSWSYAKLKRDKELNRCYKPELLQQSEDSSIYDLDNLKPVTLVLRKISIQNADENMPPVVQGNNIEINSSENTVSPSHNRSSMGTSVGSRVGSALSRDGSISRNGSVKFGAGSPMPMLVGSPAPIPTSPQNLSAQNNTSRSSHSRRSGGGITRVNSAVSQKELLHKSQRSKNVRDVRVVNDEKPKEPMWSQQYSYIDRQTIDRQATNYCIGDLLPAVDKNIYTNNSSRTMFSIKPENDRKKEELTTTELLDMNIQSVDDGYILLKKGMDLLTGSAEKLRNKKKTLPTLGPPPFRPNQSRHPLMRSVTVIIDSKTDSGHSHAPMLGQSGNKTIRVNSDKGPRFNMVDDDRETQKKLKDAFSKFYKNRPKEIGKEFRKMETMWKT